MVTIYLMDRCVENLLHDVFWDGVPFVHPLGRGEKGSCKIVAGQRLMRPVYVVEASFSANVASCQQLY